MNYMLKVNIFYRFQYLLSERAELLEKYYIVCKNEHHGIAKLR